MNGAEIIIVFGGAAVLAVLFLIFAPAAVLRFLPKYLALILPILGRRASQEQEKASNDAYRRGEDHNPLPANTPGRRKWLFGKGGIFSK